MKKLFYSFVVAAIALVSCNNLGKGGYIVTGTVEGAANGDTVYLQERVDRQFVKLDTAIINNNSFTFEGTQDSVVNRYITYKKGETQLIIDFFLESGTINVALTSGAGDAATGTANNDAYQEFRSQMSVISEKQNKLYESMADTTLTDVQREAKTKEMNTLEEEMLANIKLGIKKNITNTVGIFLLGQYNYYLNYTDMEPLVEQIPANYQANETVVHIKEVIATAKATDVGKKFVDFEMLTPEGKPVKLSDYAGKEKVVLVDFWASWCGPCRREMPNLIDLYKKYKSKGFEIVGVSLDQSGEAWKSSIKQLNLTWPQMSDLKYWNSEGAKLYAIRSIPHVVLIDKDGTIIARGLNGEELQARLEKMFK